MRAKRRAIELLALVIAISLAVCWLGEAFERYWYTVYPNTYEEVVLDCATEYDVSPSLVMGIIHTESAFDENARSAAGAIGLMQITTDTFEWAQNKLKIDAASRLTSEKLFDPEISIQYGTYILKLLKKEFPDENTAIAAYNAGIGNVRSWLKDARYSEDGVHLKEIPFKETENYVNRVRKAQEIYQKLYEYK